MTGHASLCLNELCSLNMSPNAYMYTTQNSWHDNVYFAPESGNSISPHSSMYIDGKCNMKTIHPDDDKRSYVFLKRSPGQCLRYVIQY